MARCFGTRKEGKEAEHIRCFSGLWVVVDSGETLHTWGRDSDQGRGEAGVEGPEGHTLFP